MHPALKHHSHLLNVMTSSHVSVLSISYSFRLVHSLPPHLSSIRKKDALRGNMAGFQRERLMGQCGLVLVSRALNARLLCVWDKSIHQFSIWFPFPLLPYFFIWRVYCFFMELLLIIYIFPCLILCPTFVLFFFFVFFTRNRLVQCPLQTPD